MTHMHEFRVTQYDPAKRDEHGAYQTDEWTMFSQIGEERDGVVLTLPEYERVEAAYIQAALAFVREAGIDALQVCGLEGPEMTLVDGRHVTEAEALTTDRLPAAFRAVLREEMWCRFEHLAGVFVHFGWDYYMYIGVPTPCPTAQGVARDLGLFVETWESPYKPE